jgi:hypothetical protein
LRAGASFVVVLWGLYVWLLFRGSVAV